MVNLVTVNFFCRVIMRTLLALAFVALLLVAAAAMLLAIGPTLKPAASAVGPDPLDSANTPDAIEASVTAAPIAADVPSWRARLLELEAETDADRRSKGLAEVSEAILETELSATLDALATDSGAAANELRQLLVRRWAKADAPASAVWVARLPEGAAFRD